MQQVTEVKQVPEDPPETKKLLINHPGREYTCAEFAHLVDRLKDNRTTRRRLPRRRRQGRRQGRRRLPRRRRRLERRRRRLEHTVSITFLISDREEPTSGRQGPRETGQGDRGAGRQGDKGQGDKETRQGNRETRQGDKQKASRTNYCTVKFLFAADVAGKLFVYCKLKILSNCPARGTVGQLGLVCTQFFLHYPKRLPAIIWLHGT